MSKFFSRRCLENCLSCVTLPDMRYAIFADIHNDAAALSAVLHHAGTRQVDAYFCLGDVGIDACVNRVREVGAPTVFGNWEAANWRYLSPENQQWALRLPAIRKKEGFWLTHAAPLWPDKLATLADLNAQPHLVPRSKLFPYLHYESDALWQTVARLTEAHISVMFHGHTHRQMAWRFTKDNELQRVSQQTISVHAGDTLIVGIGSVGRPQDGPGASYVIYNDEARLVEMIRVQK